MAKPMKLIIAGSRKFNNYSLLIQAVLDFIKDEKPTIISGGAFGADKLGERLAREHQFDLIQMIPDWDSLGRRAGIVRNEEMAKIATHCIVFWDGESKGTKHMISMCKKYNLVYEVVRV